MRHKLFGLREEMAQLRYERPVIGWGVAIGQWVLTVGILFILAWKVSNTVVGEVLGLSEVKRRIGYSIEAASWYSKGVPAAESLTIAPQRYRGIAERVSQGKLLVTYYENGRAKQRIVKLSNVEVNDLDGFSSWAGGYILKPMMVDFYLPMEMYGEHEVWAAVIWVSKKPINVELVEQGIGTPELDPITTAVNMVFSQWYLQKALGRH